jgi:hypothetical protein
MKDLEMALGQFILYRNAMRKIYPGRELFLAIPETVYFSLVFGIEGRADR